MSRLRTIAADLVGLLDDAVTPIYVLDDSRRLVYCNPACARWVNAKAAELVGQLCAFHAPDESQGAAAAAAGLCPPPKVFSGQAHRGLVSKSASDGRLAFRRGHFWPLADGQDESSPVLAILDPEDCDGPGAEPIDSRAAAAEDAHLHELVRRFRHQLAGRFRADSLIGSSPLATRVRTQIDLAIDTRAHVLCIGPAGAGKSHVAKAIHYGQRASGPLVPLACGMLETNLLRSTIRAAWLRHATMEGPATLLLEDVESMADEVQRDLVELLRENRAGVRVIATTTSPLGELVGEDRLTRDLACAVSTITIELAPLSRRLEDLPLLAQAFLEKLNATSTKQLGGFSPEALDQLATYSWPENLDELAAIVSEAHERAQGGEVTARDLPERIRWAAGAALHPPRVEEPIVLEEFLARLERELIARALRRAKGNKSKAAKLLGLTRPRLYRRLVQLGMEQDEGKDRSHDA